MPLFGFIGDRIGHRTVFMLGAVGILIAAAPMFFGLLASKDVFWINIAMILAIGLVYGLLYGPEGSLFSSQFPPEVRYTGISLAVQVSGALGGGLAPIVATYLIKANQGDPQYVISYLSGLSIVALISVYFQRGTYDADALAKTGASESLTPAAANRAT